MLPAGKHVREVYEGSIFGKAPTNAILMDCSTIDVASEEGHGATFTIRLPEASHQTAAQLGVPHEESTP